MKKSFLVGLIVAIAVACGFCIRNTFADSVPSVKDGQKLCATFTYEVPGNSVGKQDFQVCGIVDKNKKFKGSLQLRDDHWNNSIAYVEANGNVVTVYDTPTNNNWVTGGRPGCIAIPGICSNQKTFKAEVGQSFADTMYGLRNYLSSLSDRKYWPGGANANFKYEIDWRVEDSTADDTLAVANNKKKCEDGGGEWTGDANSGYTCSNDDSLNIAGSSTNAGASGSSGGNACYSNAGALGWVLCPVIDTATGAINSIYHELEENYLKIDVGNIFNDSSGVELAWSTFRDIANIVFIILFVIVILSQLTGFGIDNYGIKKILPKLIVVAILLNLSYIICQLAVDASNILGVGLRGFLEGLIPANPISGTNPDGAQWTVNLAGGAIMIGAAIGLTGGIGMLAAILGAVITAVVAVFFLWIILVIRSAGIVILITIAPLAIACYLLPNTEKLGKRWLDIFKALLVLYPLCSLVVGAGALAGHILSYSNSEIMQLAAMIVQVVPFFLIPMLLRNSLNAMGNIGARINGLSQAQGRNLSGRARQGLNNTNFAQNRRFNAMQRRTGLRIGAANYANGDRGNRLTRGLAGLVGGSRQTQSRFLAARDKMEAQELAGSRLLARQDLGRAEARFNELANSENLSRAEQNELNGIISEFANTPGYANKIVKKISSGEASAAFTQAVAAHAANNSDVSAAINGKNAVMARYLADVANGNSGVSASTSFNNAYDTEDKRAEVAAGMSDREVASQSAESMRNLLNTDPARISRIAQNDKIMGDIDAENAELIRDSQTAEGIADGGKIYHTSGMRGDAIKKFNQQHNLDISNSGWNKQNGSVKIYEKTENGKTYIFNAKTGDISVV